MCDPPNKKRNDTLVKGPENAKQLTSRGLEVTSPSGSSPSTSPRPDGNDVLHGVSPSAHGSSSSNQAAGSLSAQARYHGNKINYVGTLHFHSELL